MYTELVAPGWSVKKQSVYKPLYLFDGVLLAETCYCLQLYSNQVGFFNKCFFNNCFFTEVVETGKFIEVAEVLRPGNYY